MADAALLALALALVGAAGTAIALALRNSQLVADAAECRAGRTSAEKQLSVTGREFADYKQRTDAQLDAARANAKELRDDLEKCNAPGAQRARLDSLLGQLAPRDPAAKRTGPLPAVTAAGAPTDLDGGA